ILDLAWKNSSNSFTHQYDTDGRSILRGLLFRGIQACPLDKGPYSIRIEFQRRNIGVDPLRAMLLDDCGQPSWSLACQAAEKCHVALVHAFGNGFELLRLEFLRRTFRELLLMICRPDLLRLVLFPCLARDKKTYDIGDRQSEKRSSNPRSATDHAANFADLTYG